MRTPHWITWVLADLSHELAAEKYRPVREKLQQAIAELEKIAEDERHEVNRHKDRW